MVAGVAAGVQPGLVVAGLLGLAILSVILVNVTAGLLLFLIVAFLESLPTAAGAPSVAKLVGVVLVIGWLGVVAFGRADERASYDFLARNAALAVVIGLFIAWVISSQIWAEDMGLARETAIRYTLNFVLFPIVYVAIRTPRHVVWLFAVYVGSALLVTMYGLQSSGGITSDERLGGAGLNPNQLGALLAVGVILATALAFYRPLGVPARILAGLGASLCTVAVIMTESRGALLGLIASLIVTPFLVGPGRRARAGALVLGGAVAISVWLALVAPQTTVDRLTQAGSGSGRVDLWTIGLRMVDDRPITGVGAGNFKVASIHYLLEPGTIDRPQYIIDEPKPPHNIYLQLLSELGIPGIALFGIVLLACLGLCVRAARAFARNGDRDSELLARGLLIALVGLLAADFFSTELYSKQLYILLALAPALAAMASRRADRATISSPRP